jgi:ABC-type bacteriocin/lantibiotic exporter with double-glycine peptidase domain
MDLQKTIDLIANALKEIEELIYQDDEAVVLPNFPRTIQLDGWTCGARSVYSILRYFGKRCTVKSVERELRTDWEGTDVADIKKVFQNHHLKPVEKKNCHISDLRKAIDDGKPVLISTHDSWHYAVAYGYSNTYIFVMNPAIIGSCGNLWCRVLKKKFLAEFDGWGIAVSDG